MSKKLTVWLWLEPGSSVRDTITEKGIDAEVTFTSFDMTAITATEDEFRRILWHVKDVAAIRTLASVLLSRAFDPEPF